MGVRIDVWGGGAMKLRFSAVVLVVVLMGITSAESRLA